MKCLPVSERKKMIRSRLVTTSFVRTLASNPIRLGRYLSTVENANPTIEVTLRQERDSGSRASRKLRSNGLIPGVVYGYDDDWNILNIKVTTNWKVLDKELRTRGRTFENTLFDLTVVDDTPEKNVIAKYPVTPRDTTFNAMTRKPICVNFLRYWKRNEIVIPVDFANMDLSEAKKKNCTFIAVNSNVKCVCTNGVIPRVLKLDLSNAQKGDVYRLNSIEFPKYCRPAKSVPPDLVICSVKSK